MAESCGLGRKFRRFAWIGNADAAPVDRRSACLLFQARADGPRRDPIWNSIVTEHDIEWDEAKVARLWNHHASVGAGYLADKHGARILRASGLPLREPLRVLDYGSGPGFLWRHLEEPFRNRLL